MRRMWLATGCLAAVMLAVPAVSRAAVTIGSDLSPEVMFAGTCDGAVPCTVTNTALPGRQIVSPNDGVVVRWRVRVDTGVDPETGRLKVIRPAGGGTYTSVNTSATRTFPNGLPPTTLTSPTRQAIAAGDRIALDLERSTAVLAASQAGVTVARWQPPLADGGVARLPTTTFADSTEVLFNADVEPDADCDGFGDETQDPSVSGGCVPPPPGGSPPSSEFSFGNVKRNKKNGTAKLTIEVPGSGDLELLASNKLKATNKRAQAAGEVKLAIKPKRKAKKKLAKKGRAKVKAEVTYTPDGGEPNTKSKRIKLRKRA